MLKIKNNSRITFHWKVSPYDFSKEKLNRIIIKASKKYNVPKLETFYNVYSRKVLLFFYKCSLFLCNEI